VTFPYVPVFLAVLLVYMVYSEWALLDSRYLVAGALVLLIVTAVVDAAGATATANTLAEFVFFLLAGGVILLLVDHVRERPRREPPSARGSGLRAWEPPAADAAQEPERASDQPFDRPEEESVSVVHAPGE
jgi:hypothetical protein